MAIKPGSIIFDEFNNHHMILNIINKQYRLYQTKNLTDNETYKTRIIKGRIVSLEDTVFDGVDNKRLQQKENKLLKIINDIDKNKEKFYDFRQTKLVILKKYNKRNINSKYIGSGNIEKSIRNCISFIIENELLTYNTNDIITTNILLNNVIVRKDKYFCHAVDKQGYYFTRFDREYFI